MGALPRKGEDISVPDALYPPNIMTGVDRVHATGNAGKGIKIGIIDTGVDYTHPALGGGFGKGKKFVGGYDFVGDDYPVGDPVPDADPLSQCNGHGTHVAGILGADPKRNEYNITGVAHQAEFRAYRVFGCLDSTDDAIIVDALIRAHKDGNDVITLSLGHVDGWTEGTASVVASRIAERGRVVTVAAGNSGEQGAWYTESPANGISTISVASTNNAVYGPIRAAKASVEHAPILYYGDEQFMDPNNPSPIPADGAFPIYATSRDSSVEDDACTPLPDSTPDLSKFVTLVRRGSCDFIQKVANVQAKGGEIVLIYNNGNPFAPIISRSPKAALIQEADGLWLLEQFLANKNVTLSFPAAGSYGYLPNVQDGGLVSAFTTYGPTFDMLFKPALAAPGGGILSLWPTTMGSYAISSGTSMATPHAAGVAALVLKAKGKGAARGMRELLQTTAQPVPASLDEGAPPHTLIQQGAGQINAWNALSYTSSLTPAELLLNDTAHWRGAHTLWIANRSRKTKVYRLKHVPSRTVLTRQKDSIQPAFPPLETVDAAVRVAFSASRVTVLPGGRVPVRVTISPPRNVDGKRVPVLSGQIEVSTAGETLRASYLGAATALKSVQVLDDTDFELGWPTPLLLDANGGVQADETAYTMRGEDYPVLAWRQVFGTPSVRIDLVSAAAKLPAHARNVKRAGSKNRFSMRDWFPSWWFPGPRPGGTFARVPTLGPLFQYDYLWRNDLDALPYFESSVRAFANGTAIPVGRYRVLVRALRVSGDVNRQEDYEAWLSPVVAVVEPPKEEPAPPAEEPVQE
ncbi:subtilisin-like protein [Auricularia subglabra TFB-10046 SS5]|nr:subtilisin-like protein [Auricularia subglabra TFB-10046 SS5]